MEEIVYGEHSFEIPGGISQDFNYLLEIISPDTWNNILTDEHRQHLMKFLPDFPENDLGEKTQTLEMFFMNKNFYFGSPLYKFFMDMNKGYFNHSFTKLRKINRKLLHKAYRYRQKQYYHKLLEEIIIERKNLIDGVKNSGSLSCIPCCKPQYNKIDRRDVCIQRARKRYFRELKSVKSETGCDSISSEDENYPEGPGMTLNKKQCRQLFLMESSFPANLYPVRGTHTRGSLALDLEARITTFENPFDMTDEHLKNMVSNHIAKRKKHSITTDTRGITMQNILERAQMYSKKPLQRPQPLCLPLSSPGKSALSPLLRKSVVKKKMKPAAKEKLSYKFSTPLAFDKDLGVKGNDFPLSKERSSDESSSDVDMESVEKVETDATDLSLSLEEERSLFASELTQETHISFFSLLRDVICSTAHQRMTKQQLEKSIKTWQESAISPLNEWFCLSESWVDALSAAVNFLCGNLSSDLLPTDFVPFIEHKCTSKCFQWIGAGRDSDTNLEPLCQFWLSNRNGMPSVWPSPDSDIGSSEELKKVASPKSVPSWNLSPASDSSSNVYHLQERLRYSSPHKAFTYRMNGYESVIGPVKGVYSQQVSTTSKARDHTLLMPNRPPYVTILSLVWDAVARLPNGEGAKTDICKLVKESQFIVPISSPALESTLTNVVSGALDRLQNEKDPCVKFDTSRKLWVYLHSNRTEEEFERMHHLNGPFGANKKTSSRKQKVKKEDLSKGPPNVAMEQFSTAIKHMDGSEVRVKDEDLLKNWVKISTAPIKKNETVKITSSQLKADLAKMKAAKAAAESVEANKLQSSFKSPLPQAASSLGKKSVSPSQVQKIAASPVVTLPEDSIVGTAKVCSSFQFSKKSKTVPKTASSSPITSSASHPAVVTKPVQGARKYQSASEKKKTAKSVGVCDPSSSCKTATAVTSNTNPQFTRAPITEATPVTGIKLLQFTNPNIQGKSIVGSSPIVVDAGTALPATLVGQKLVLSGNRVLVHGGKVLQNVAGTLSTKGKQILAGVLPAQHIMALSSVKKSSSDQVSIEGGGRFIQLAAIDGGASASAAFQKVTLVPQFSQASVTVSEPKGTEGQSVSSAVTAMKGAIATGELKFKLSGATASFATTSGNITGNLISLGGKQILLTTKGSASSKATPQFHQVLVGDPNTVRVENSKPGRKSGEVAQQILLPHSAGGQTATVQTTTAGHSHLVSSNVSSQQHVVVPMNAASGQQFVVPSNATGQQIVVSAAALQGAHLKRLQAFQSFKVVPASQLSPQQKSKPVVAHILASSTCQQSLSGATKVAVQLASDSQKEEK